MSGFLGRMVPYGEASAQLFSTREEAESGSSEHYVTLGVRMTIVTQEKLSRHSAQPVQVEGVFAFDPLCWPRPDQAEADYSCFPPRPMRVEHARLLFPG